VSPLDPLAAGADAKRTEALLRDARAVLRKLDVLLAEAAALDDPAAVPAGEARATVERLVRDLDAPSPGPRPGGGRAARRGPGQPRPARRAGGGAPALMRWEVAP
jgi:hypothetical protein